MLSLSERQTVTDAISLSHMIRRGEELDRGKVEQVCALLVRWSSEMEELRAYADAQDELALMRELSD